ncbi:MAG: M56 family metallopeptidase, partial [Flavonifractor sp.]|nr:M56 family metallopeptidase [Flavonifractor sp.]
MREFLSGLFEVSLTMGAVTALLLILSPVWKRRFRPQWRCWAWLLVALRLAVPFNVSLPRAPVVLEAPAPAAVSAAWVEEGGFQGVELTARTLPPGEAAPEAVGRGLSLTTAELAFAVWAAVAAGVLAGRLLRYAAFRRRTARWCTPAGAYEGVPVYACALLSSPALTGLLRPRILLPEGVEEERRAFALAHEAMHARRRDLWRKALLLWVCALHWFNPLVWLLRRAAERDMEIACDAAVLAGRDGEWRRRYGAALLSFVPVGRPAPLTSQFAGGARGLKERFRALMDASAKRPGRAALLLVLCAALLGGPLVACQSRAPEESLPDGTYWMVPAKLEWQEPLERLAVHMAEVDGKTMELLDVGRETLVFPLAEEVILGNYAEQGIKEFLETSVSLSYAKQVLEVEMEDGKIAAMTSRAVFPPDGLTEYPEYPVKEPDLADGTYWATLSLSDWWTAGEEGIELLLSLVEVDTDTMTLLRVAPEKTSLPVADDVTLGNHGDSGLDGFLQWAAISSYWPMVLEAEVAGGEITALTWHDANLPLDPDPLSQWEQKADHPASHYTGLPDGTYWAIPMSA